MKRLGMYTGKVYTEEQFKNNEIEECCRLITEDEAKKFDLRIKKFEEIHEKCNGCKGCPISKRDFKEECFKKLEDLEPYPLDSLMESKEFKYLRENLPITASDTVYSWLKGYKVLIEGDITDIINYGKNIFKLVIIYTTKPDIISSFQTVSVKTSDEKLIEKIKKLKPNTKIICEASFEGHIGMFNLIEIADSENTMKFGKWKCSDCDYDFGVTEPIIKSCPICGNEIINIKNIYD